MRDFSRIDSYLNRLSVEIYPQPPDAGHSGLSEKVIDFWMSRLTTCHSVLDVGAGQGFCQPIFEKWGVEYQGIALGEDVIEASKIGRKVSRMDYSFLDYSDKSFDLIFSRHSLEHSPFPLLSLMEWHRVSKSWLGLVLPSVEWYGVFGQNHYYVLTPLQWKNLLEKSGWRVMWETFDEILANPRVSSEEKKIHEYWFMCEKI